jgi:hypothetical protein
VRRDHDAALFVHTWQDDAEDPVVRHALDALRPVSVRRDPPISVDAEQILPVGTANRAADAEVAARLASMWTSIGRGLDLVEEAETDGARFDVIVRTRPDVLWDIAGELSRYDGRARFARYHAARPQPSDLGFIVPRADADTVFRVAERLPDLATEYPRYGYRILVPEFVLGHVLDTATIRWVAAGWDAVVVRPDGQELWFDGDPDSRAFKSGRGIHESRGDALAYGEHAPATSARIATEVAFNIGDRGPGDRELIAASPALVQAMGDGDPAVAGALVSAFRHPPGRLGRVMLTGMILDARRRWPGEIDGALRRHPVTTFRLAMAATGFVSRRWLRRLRSSLTLGLPPHYGPPISLHPAPENDS